MKKSLALLILTLGAALPATASASVSYGQMQYMMPQSYGYTGGNVYGASSSIYSPVTVNGYSPYGQQYQQSQMPLYNAYNMYIPNQYMNYGYQQSEANYYYPQSLYNTSYTASGYPYRW